MEKSAVIIGRNYVTLLGLARDFGAAGYEVGILRTNRKKGAGLAPEAACKYVKQYVTTEELGGEKVVKLLLDQMAKPDRKTVLVPVEDISAEFLDQNYDVLSTKFALPNVKHTQGEMIRLMDKDYQCRLAEEAGLTVPKHWTVELKNGGYVLPETVEYPCFAKPATPIYGRKQFMGKCGTEAELRALLDRTAENGDCSMLLQEFISIEKEYGAVGVADGERVCVSEVIAFQIGGKGSHEGVACTGTVLSPDRFAPEVEKIKEMLRRLDYQGMFDIDLYESRGTVYFCELNVRLGASGVSSSLAGVNLAHLLGAALLGENGELALDAFDAKCREMSFANERPNLDNFGDGLISWWEYRRRMRSAELRFVCSKDDPGPFRVYRMMVLRKILRRIKRRLRRK